MFHFELAPLGGILDPLKSDLGVFWAIIPLSSHWFYNVKTQKTQFLQNSQWVMAEIENIHCPICTQPIPSSWQNALPPALATDERRGAYPVLNTAGHLDPAPPSKFCPKSVRHGSLGGCEIKLHFSRVACEVLIQLRYVIFFFRNIFLVFDT